MGVWKHVSIMFHVDVCVNCWQWFIYLKKYRSTRLFGRNTYIFRKGWKGLDEERAMHNVLSLQVSILETFNMNESLFRQFSRCILFPWRWKRIGRVGLMCYLIMSSPDSKVAQFCVYYTFTIPVEDNHPWVTRQFEPIAAFTHSPYWYAACIASGWLSLFHFNNAAA